MHVLVQRLSFEEQRINFSAMAYMCSCSYERTGIQSGYIYAFHVLNVRCSGEMTSQKSNMGTTNYISILYGKRV